MADDEEEPERLPFVSNMAFDEQGPVRLPHRVQRETP
jgi:hypothetical protein